MTYSPSPATPRTLASLLGESVRRHPDRSAVIEPRGTGTRSLTYRQLDAAVGEMTARLRAAGLRRGDVVAVWLPNSLEWLAAEFAAARIGAAVLGVNTRYREHELAHLLRTARPACVVAPARFLGIDFAGVLRRAAASSRAGPGDPNPPFVVLAGDDPGADIAAWDVGGGAARLGALGGTGAAPGPPAGGGLPSDLANLFTTSGSTSAPKIAGHDQASVAAHSLHVAHAFGLGAGDRLVCALPLCGVFGFNGAMAALAAGACCLLEPVFEEATVLAHASEHRVTHLAGGDDMYLRLIEAYRRDRADLSSWRRGAIADFTGRAHDVVRWVDEHIGARLTGVYGSSECFALMATWAPELPAHQRARAGGRPVSPDVQVRVAGERTGRRLGPNQPGELQIRGYNVLAGYLGNPDATAAAFTADGWFRSGDLGYLEEPGTFVYMCRIGDALRLRGFLVEPAEIESFLAGHPAVEGARVVGVKGPDGGDVAVAFVTAAAGRTADAAEILRFCRERLASYKVPAHVFCIGEFPITTGTNGTKILTRELREMALRRLEGPRQGPGADG